MVLKRYFAFVFVLILMLLVGCTKTRKEEGDFIAEEVVEEISRQVSFVAVGDNLIHDAIYRAAYKDGEYDFKPFYASIKPLIQNFDLAFVNQETMLGGVELGLSSYPSFNSPVEVGEALVDAGFNLFSIANNHTLDRGEKAILNTIKFFEGQDVQFSGAKKSNAERDVKIFTVNDITFGFVAYTMLTNGQYHPQGKTYLANVYSRNKAKEDLSNIRDEVDVLLVSMHWGNEYEDHPSNVQKNEAAYLSELGVDLIIGHHPHVIQPIEWIKREGMEPTLVLYSLGNFLSAQKGVDRKIGMAVSLDFVMEKEGLTIKDVTSTLLYHYKEDEALYTVLPYHRIDHYILPDYDRYFAQKAMLIQYYDPTLVVE